MGSTRPANLNQIDVTQVRAFIDRVGAVPVPADRDPHVIVRCVGESRAKGTFDAAMHLGGDGELNPMRALLGSLALCDVDLVAMHTSLLGSRSPSCGSRRAATSMSPVTSPGQRTATRLPAYRLHGAPSRSGGIREQIGRLRDICETGSPVGDTMTRPIPATLNLDAASAEPAPRPIPSGGRRSFDPE